MSKKLFKVVLQVIGEAYKIDGIVNSGVTLVLYHPTGRKFYVVITSIVETLQLITSDALNKAS